MAEKLDLSGRLKYPFKSEDIEWRVQRAGLYKEAKGDKVGWAMVLAYVTNRAIQDRLDEQCGIENWRNEFARAPEGGVMCGISIRIGNDWITKWDGAENTNVEAVKGGLSSAMKRAAVQWGIGRYLYGLEENFVHMYESSEKGKFHHYDKDTKKRYFWEPPKLPRWALPNGGDNE